MPHIRKNTGNQTVFFYILIFFLLLAACKQNDVLVSLDTQKLFRVYHWQPLWAECKNQEEKWPAQEKEMLAFYQNKIQEEPQNPEWYFLYGRLLGMMGETESSIFFFQKALQKDYESLWGHYGMAMYYLQKKDIFQAQIYFSQCLFYEENFVPALLGMAKISLEQSPSLSIGYLKKCIALMPHDASLHNSLGNLYFFHTKEKNKAEPYLTEAVRLSPQNPVFLKELALFYFDAQKNKECIELLRKLMDLLPDRKQKQKIFFLMKKMMK